MERGLGLSQRLYFSLTISVFLITILLISIITYDVKGVEGLYDDDLPPDYDQFGPGGGFGGGDPLGMNDPYRMRDYDQYPFRQDELSPHMHRERADMLGDIADEKAGLKKEVNLGHKRFKLYEKKPLMHKKAALFCKKREGRLAQAMNVDEMQRLQTLLMKAKMVSTNLWVGADKKEWKQHSLRQLRRQFNPDLGPNAKMMGGGPTEMCPALSTSTRALTPAECFREYPFVCEFAPGKGKLPKSNKPKNATKDAKKKSQKPRKMDEMRKKREVVLLPQPDPEPEPESEPTTKESVQETTKYAESSPTTMMINESSTTESSSSTTELTNDLSAMNQDIGFKPHIISAEMQDPVSMLPEATATMETTKTSTQGFGSATARMFVELHRGFNLEQNVKMGIDEPIGMSTQISDATGSESSADTTLVNTEMTSTEIDPDQQLVNLIDEQSKSMSLGDPVPEPEAEPEPESEPEPTDASATPNATVSVVDDANCTNTPSTSGTTPSVVLEIEITEPAAKLGEVESSTEAAMMTSRFTPPAVPDSSSQPPPMSPASAEVEMQEITASPRMDPPTTQAASVTEMAKDQSQDQVLAAAPEATSGKRPNRHIPMPSLLVPIGTMASAVKRKENHASSSSVPLLTPRIRRASLPVPDFGLSFDEMNSAVVEEIGVSKPPPPGPSALGRFNRFLDPNLWQDMDRDRMLLPQWPNHFNHNRAFDLHFDEPVIEEYAV